MKTREECLQILGQKSGASRAEIKTAYHDLVKVWHPDRFVHDPQLAKKADEKLKEINEAYQIVLRPPESRAQLRGSRNPMTTILLILFGVLILSFFWYLRHDSSKATKTRTYLQQIA